MKQEVKVKWTQALRSGEFRQGKHALRQRNLTDEFDRHSLSRGAV